MLRIFLKHQKVIAIVIGISFLLAAVPLAMGGLKTNPVKAATSDDKSMSEEISNMTGVKVDEILQLKYQGKSWNEVLDTLKNNESTQKEKDTRSNLLTRADLGKDYLSKLKNEGFKENEISEVKLLAERLIFQLQEITSDTGKAAIPKAEMKETGSEDTQAYADLLGKFDLQTACYLMLKLKKDFGSFENVVDEYLYSLQLGIELEEYIIDRKTYQKEKDEKSVGFDPQKVINLQKIDELVLKKVQDENKANLNSDITETDKKSNADKSENSNYLPEQPKPNVKDVKPKNPAEEIMEDIKDINPTGN